MYLGVKSHGGCRGTSSPPPPRFKVYSWHCYAINAMQYIVLQKRPPPLHQTLLQCLCIHATFSYRFAWCPKRRTVRNREPRSNEVLALKKYTFSYVVNNVKSPFWMDNFRLWNSWPPRKVSPSPPGKLPRYATDPKRDCSIEINMHYFVNKTISYSYSHSGTWEFKSQNSGCTSLGSPAGVPVWVIRPHSPPFDWADTQWFNGQ